MIIKVLGTWCPKCKLLEQTTRDWITQLWIQAEVMKIENMEDIIQYDIMSTPALVIDEKVVIFGRVPDIEEMKNILTNQR